MYTNDRVNIYVPRASGDFVLKLGVPKIFGGPQGSDKDQDILNIVDWLTGGESGDMCQETECYGIVKMNLSDIHVAALFDVMLEKGDTTKGLTGNLKKEMDIALKDATERSRKRVYSSIRRVYRQLKDQYAKNKEANVGNFEPSPAEYLCKIALKKEIQAEEARRQRLIKEMDEPLKSAVRGS